MSLHDTITDILAAAVENHECAGVNVLLRRHGEEILYTQAGMRILRRAASSSGTPFSACTANQSPSPPRL